MRDDIHGNAIGKISLMNINSSENTAWIVDFEEALNIYIGYMKEFFTLQILGTISS